MIPLWGFQHVYQLPLPGFEPDILSDLPGLTRKALGRIGELTTWRALEASGYVVQRGRRFAGDLRAISEAGEVFRVEVKTARRTKNGIWSFNLYRKVGERLCTDYRHADVVVLLAVLPDALAVPFLIPCKLLDQHQITVSGNPATYERLKAFRRDELPFELETARV